MTEEEVREMIKDLSKEQIESVRLFAEFLLMRRCMEQWKRLVG